MAEGRSRLKTALAGRSERNDDRACALSAAGAFAGYQGHLQDGRPTFDEAIDPWRELDRARGLWQSLFDLGWGSFYADDDAAALRCFRESLDISERLGEAAW